MNIKTKFELEEEVFVLDHIILSSDPAEEGWHTKKATVHEISVSSARDAKGYDAIFYKMVGIEREVRENNIFKTEEEAQEICDKLNIEGKLK